MKIPQLKQYLKEHRLDAALFFNTSLEKQDPLLRYFSGIEIESGMLVIPQKRAPFLLVSLLELKRMKEHASLRCFAIKQGMFQDLKKRLGNLNRIGINAAMVTLAEHKRLKGKLKVSTVDISRICAQLRQQKTSAELKMMKKACRITDDLFRRLIQHFATFTTEADVATYLIAEASRLGCGMSFPPIVASGKHASQPHYETQLSPLHKGFCIIDFGVKLKGYCSDMTRTIYLGKPSQQDKSQYHLVLKVQSEAIKSARVSKSCAELHQEAARGFGPLKKYFIHGLGHGIGLSVHERPGIGRKSKERLQENMVIAIEPGLYRVSGIRIEDDVMITRNGPLVLTKAPKDLISIRQGVNP